MAYTRPGVTVERITLEGATPEVSASLPAMIVGPLYHVVDQSVASARFNALDSSPQTFSWPGKITGAVVDLGGTRNGLMDSQRKELFDYPPQFFLRDPATLLVSAVEDAYVQGIGQSGFSLLQAARTGKERTELTFWRVELNGAYTMYRPPISGTTGFTLTRVGDRFTVDGTGYTVASRTDTLLTASPAPIAASTSVRIETDGSDTINITLAATPGRVVATVAGTDYPTESAAWGVGDPAVVYAGLTGFVSIAGAVVESGITYDQVDGLVISAVFAEEALVGRWAKVVNTTQATTTWARVTAYDPDLLTIDFDTDVGAANNDVVAVTVYDAVLGYVESLNTLGTQATIVVSRTFAATGSAIDLYPTAEAASKFYPDFEVLASYRELRRDLANQALSASNATALTSLLGHASIVPEDGLAFAVRVAQQAQGIEAQVYFVPVDVEPAGATGLPENQDLVAGYTAALLAARGPDVYGLVVMDVDNAAVRAVYEAHITSMLEVAAKRERYGFQFQPVPLGDVESQSGIIEPGRTVTGTASSETDGNLHIRDASVDFVTSAGVVEGTRVVITYPEVYAGEYVALGTTTDEVLVLEGDPFAFSKTGERTTAGLTLATSGGIHTLSGAAAGHWNDLEAGDYVHITVDGTAYRLRVTGVISSGAGLTMVDEAAGELSFTGLPLTGNVFAVRSWGSESNPPSVRYYIRPLTTTQQVAKLKASKQITNNNYTLTLDHAPTFQVGVDGVGAPILAELSPAYVLCALAGLRAGNVPHQDLTELFIGGGILSARWAYNEFGQSELDELAEAGFTLLEQSSASAQPYIRDMLTSDTVGGLVNTQEVVRSNSAWQAKTLRLSLQGAPGRAKKRQSAALAGFRSAQVSSLLQSWQEEGRLDSYDNLAVRIDTNNKTRTVVSYVGYMVVAEKVVHIEMSLAV